MRMNDRETPETLTYDGEISDGAAYAAEIFTGLIKHAIDFAFRDPTAAADAFRDGLAARLSAELDDTENVRTDYNGQPFTCVAVYNSAALYELVATFGFKSWEVPGYVSLTVKRDQVTMRVQTPGLTGHDTVLFDANTKPLAELRRADRRG